VWFTGYLIQDDEQDPLVNSFAQLKEILNAISGKSFSGVFSSCPLVER